MFSAYLCYLSLDPSLGRSSSKRGLGLVKEANIICAGVIKLKFWAPHCEIRPPSSAILFCTMNEVKEI